MTLPQLCFLPLGILILIVVSKSIKVQAQQQQQHHQTTDYNRKQPSGTSNQQQEVVGAATSGQQCGGDSKYAAAALAGYLLADPTDSQLNRSDALDSKLATILERIGPDMRPLRDFREFDDIISVDVARRAWKLMHDHALAASVNRLSLVRPIVQRALEAANVSGGCLEAAGKTMDAAQRLDSWAIQLLTAWGNFPPTGIFEGTYGDIGSFHGCVNVPQNEPIGHAHYCTIAYRPVLPHRAEYELIVRGEPEELLNMFESPRREAGAGAGGDKYGQKQDKIGMVNRDAFTDILKHAQYNHYVYYKLGTCFPIQCSPYDVQKLARLMGKQSMLMSGPVKCHSKFDNDYEPSGTESNGTAQLQISIRDLNNGVYIWKPHITQTQRVALIIISTLSLFIVLMTLVDIALNRLPKLYGILTIDSRWRRRSLENGHEAGNNDDNVGLRDLNGHGHGTKIESNGGSAPANNTTVPTRTIDQNEDNDGQSSDELDQLHATDRNDDDDSAISVNVVINGGSGDPRKQRSNRKWACKQEQARSRVMEMEMKMRKEKGKEKEKHDRKGSLFMQIVDDCSIVTNGKQFFAVSQSQLNNDILCINGIRCITMSWIIITHTMQYNDWSAFARTREIETHIKSLINQPLFNGSYLVDTFFLVSGLLTSLSSFRNIHPRQAATTKSKSGAHSNGSSHTNHNNDVNGTTAAAAAAATNNNGTTGGYSLLVKFSARSYLIGRYLRLTPQIMLVSMLFILLPLLSSKGGPHWYTITGEYAENCSQNWWLNLFYIQAFYRSNEMCNFVCWWISVDMFYHLFALAVILLILARGHRAASISCALIVIGHWIIQVQRHYQLGLPPNLLSTIPQTGAMWSEMTLQSFWTPYAHSFPFFLGLYLGYLIAQRHSKLSSWFTPTKAIVGWSLATCLLVLQSYSTYYWVIGEWRYTRLVASLFYLICPIIWASCLAWIILACQFGYGGWINSMLSCKLFLILGKASYIVYLSHFLVIFSFFGSQNLLLEPTQLVMLYVIIGNICLSMILGCCLCVVFEMPWLKAQRRIMKFVR